MRYLLDTNAVIALLRDDRSPVARRLRLLPPGDTAVSSIVMHELYYGGFKSDRPQWNVAVFDDLEFPVIDFDRDDARRAGLVRAELANRGTPIGPYDVLIAGQALARGLVLVTRNIREFSRVTDLKTENWEA